MARITRKTQKIFAGSAANNAQFGSKQNSTPNFSNDPAVIQALTAWDQGWDLAVIGASKFPCLEDFQTVDYVNTYQTSYLFQEGIPEYDSGTTYYAHSVVKKASTYQLYGSVTNANVGNALTDPTNWQLLIDLSSPASKIYTGGTSTGSANAQVVATTQGGFTLTNGNILTMVAGFTNSGSLQINADGVGLTTVKKQGTSGLINLTGGEVVVTEEYQFLVNAGFLQIIDPTYPLPTTFLQVANNLSDLANRATAQVNLGVRQALTANTSFFVATTGNDGNPGTVGSPWLTLQHAYDYIAGNIDMMGFTSTVSVGAGTYAVGVQALVPVTGGNIQFQGDLTTPTNVIISSGGNPCIAAYNGCTLMVGGFKVTGSSYLIQARGSGANITVNGNMNYGVGGGNLLGHLNAFWGGFVEVTANYTISGGAGQHYYVSGGTLRIASVTITLSGTPAFSGEFALASDTGRLEAFPITWSGSGSGVAYLANLNGAINTNGGGLPSGLSGGSVATGGQYL